MPTVFFFLLPVLVLLFLCPEAFPGLHQAVPQCGHLDWCRSQSTRFALWPAESFHSFPRLRLLENPVGAKGARRLAEAWEARIAQFVQFRYPVSKSVSFVCAWCEAAGKPKGCGSQASQDRIWLCEMSLCMPRRLLCQPDEKNGGLYQPSSV